jgi:hypothetical protein
MATYGRSALDQEIMERLVGLRAYAESKLCDVPLAFSVADHMRREGVRFAMDSPLEGGVSCELVSESGVPGAWRKSRIPEGLWTITVA